MALYDQLVDAGVHMLTVHGRTRFQKGVGTGPADWAAVRHVVDAYQDRIPILCNGSIANQQDVRDCLAQTGADGVMSSEAILEYPPLFQGMADADAAEEEEDDDEDAVNTTNNNHNDDEDDCRRILVRPEPVRIKGRLDLASEYLDLAERHPPQVHGQGSGVKCVKVHVHRFLHADLQQPANRDIRQLLVDAVTVEQIKRACELLRDRQRCDNGTAAGASHDAATATAIASEELSWYFRHRSISRDCFGITINNTNNNASNAADGVIDGYNKTALQVRMDHERTVKTVELVDDAADCFASLFDEE